MDDTASSMENYAQEYCFAKQNITKLEVNKAKAEEKNAFLNDHGKPPNTEEVQRYADEIKAEREKLDSLREQVRLSAIMIVRERQSTEP
ncbi:unnamed protein product [Linum trigynum]|uniref:Uncharacterized protein n=1 Tax=Linum trigynum TaxID=586398 RepID=A0AAV2D0N1_9ROSI